MKQLETNDKKIIDFSSSYKEMVNKIDQFSNSNRDRQRQIYQQTVRLLYQRLERAQSKLNESQKQLHQYKKQRTINQQSTINQINSCNYKDVKQDNESDKNIDRQYKQNIIELNLVKQKPKQQTIYQSIKQEQKHSADNNSSIVQIKLQYQQDGQERELNVRELAPNDVKEKVQQIRFNNYQQTESHNTKKEQTQKLQDRNIFTKQQWMPEVQVRKTKIKNKDKICPCGQVVRCKNLCMNCYVRNKKKLSTRCSCRSAKNHSKGLCSSCYGKQYRYDKKYGKKKHIIKSQKVQTKKENIKIQVFHLNQDQNNNDKVDNKQQEYI